MKKFIRKFDRWFETYEHEIAVWVTIIAIVEMFIIILTTMGFVSQVSLLHDIEAQLAAHGVDWALYTMP